jgi:hypothetical protein
VKFSPSDVDNDAALTYSRAVARAGVSVPSPVMRHNRPFAALREAFVE